MNKSFLLLFSVFIFLFVSDFQAQTYNMSNSTINSCGGNFYDSGGIGNYANSQMITMTFCSSTPGADIVIDFTSFDLESGYDFLSIYDGNNAGSPLIGTYSGTTLPGAFTSSTGCLTFVFNSDGSITQGGWVAGISCAQPCQTVESTASYNPLPNPDGIVYLCQGDVLEMNGSANYPLNGAGYIQSDATSSFEWSTQDGPSQNGQNTSHTFNNAGAYIIALQLTDVNGCENTDNIYQTVLVSTSPQFFDSPSNPSELCEGQQSALFGVASPTEHTESCVTPTPPYLALPDGSGASYSTSIDLECYGPGQTLDDITDLLDICVNMEHSYMGDLDIVIECPSGQQVTLVDYPNGGTNTFLGVPVDNDATPAAQGVGFDYCWSPSATNGDWGVNSGGTLASGTYASTFPMTNLIGCEMNGEWTLTITDNLASDNGFIFSWGINFNPTIVPPLLNFTPTIDSDSWQSDPSIVTGSNPIIIQPVSSGNLCFVYEVTDDFGCTYDTSYCIDVLPASEGTDVQNACASFTWIDGTTYTENNNSATWILTNTLGCDSTVTLDLTINSNTGNDIQTSCDSFTWIDGNTYTSSNNTATWVLTNQSGCDSIVTLDLTLTNSTSETDIEVHCDSYTWIDGNTYTESNNSATWVLTNSIGCDSIVSLNLNIINSNTGNDIQTSCDSFTWIDGNTYTSNNNLATWNLTNEVGCDSIVTLDLTLTNSSTGIDAQEHCDSYTWIDGNTYTSSNNSATWVLTNTVGCDSTVTLDLSITNSNTGTDTHTSCDSYTWMDGTTYTSSNNSATWILTNTDGCDSTVALDLTITSSNSGVDSQISCESYTWINGITYTENNNSAIWVMTNAAGCDSTITLNLTITNSNTGTDTQVSCDSYTWIDGTTYTSNNNTATWVLTNVLGCDSIVALDLTLTNSTSGIDELSSCDSYTWIDGNTYTASNNSATWVLTNSEGCDSTVALDLTITNSNNAIDLQAHCDSYTWIDGNTYTSSNSSATWVLTNTAGCDSTITLDLTITNSNSGTDIQSHCDSYTWIDGNTYTMSNSAATWVLTNETGCDSTVTLNLSIVNTNSGTDVQISCDSYTWIDGITYTSSNNSATWVLTNVAGCDSIVALDLTITNSNNGTDLQAHCDSYTWIDGNMYTTNNNTATWILTNAAGCDSTVTLDLTINDTPSFDLSSEDPSVCNAADGSILVSGLYLNALYTVSYDSLSFQSQYLELSSNTSGEILISNLGAGLYTDFTISFQGCPLLSPSVVDLNNPGAPNIVNQEDTTVCDGFILLEILGSNLSGNESYYTQTDAQGSPLFVGDSITSTQTIYIYDMTGSCADQSNFNVTVNYTPDLLDPGAQEVCGSFNLPESIAGTNLSGNENYYNDTQNNDGQIIDSAITYSQLVYLYDSDGSCSDELSFQVTIQDPPSLIGFSGEGIYCQGSVVNNIQAEVTGIPIFSIEYTLNGTPLNLTCTNGLFDFGNAMGTYILSSLTDSSCTVSLNETQTITVIPLPQIPNVSADITYCFGDALQMMEVEGTDLYTWYDDEFLTENIGSGSDYSPEPTLGSTIYYVTASDGDCEGMAAAIQITIKECDIDIPTAFTPDGDGVNDYWNLVNIDNVYPNNMVRVYNRWGGLIFESDNGAYLQRPWDGRFNGEELPVASYYFIIEFNEISVKNTTGIVTIVR